MRNADHTNTKTYIVKKAKDLAGMIAALCVAALLVHWFTGGQNDAITLDNEGTIMEGRPTAVGSPQYVLDKHRDNCWVGSETPKAQLPGAAIIQYPSGETVYTAKHNLVDAAFNEALAESGFDTPSSDEIDVVALCV